MAYRTRTYIAAAWTEDGNAIEQLAKYNDSNYWSLNFKDAHELSECRSDDTNNCNIKRNCSQNLDSSKHFVLIVGNSTDDLRSGYCMYCKDYNKCKEPYKTHKSFVEFECDYAVRNNLPIIVLYNSAMVNKNMCPASVRDKALTHAKMQKIQNNERYWDYNSIKEAFDLLS